MIEYNETERIKCLNVAIGSEVIKATKAGRNFIYKQRGLPSLAFDAFFTCQNGFLVIRKL
jgi:hypothetical protein